MQMIVPGQIASKLYASSAGKYISLLLIDMDNIDADVEFTIQWEIYGAGGLFQ